MKIILVMKTAIMITRTFIIKAKKLLNLSKVFETNKNIDLNISSRKTTNLLERKRNNKTAGFKMGF